MIDGNVLSESQDGSRVLLDPNAFVKSSGDSTLLLDANACLTSSGKSQALLDGDATLTSTNGACNLQGATKVALQGAQVSQLDLEAAGATSSSPTTKVGGKGRSGGSGCAGPSLRPVPSSKSSRSMPSPRAKQCPLDDMLELASPVPSMHAHPACIPAGGNFPEKRRAASVHGAERRLA